MGITFCQALRLSLSEPGFPIGNQDQYPGAVLQCLFGSLHHQPRLPRVEFQECAYGEDPEHTNEYLQEDGIKVLPSALHHHAQGPVRAEGGQAINPRGCHCVEYVGDGQDSPEQALGFLSLVPGIAGEIVLQMVFEDGGDDPGLESFVGTQFNDVAYAFHRVLFDFFKLLAA